jgi:hypothetical protein
MMADSPEKKVPAKPGDATQAAQAKEEQDVPDPSQAEKPEGADTESKDPSAGGDQTEDPVAKQAAIQSALTGTGTGSGARAQVVEAVTQGSSFKVQTPVQHDDKVFKPGDSISAGDVGGEDNLKAMVLAGAVVQEEAFVDPTKPLQQQEEPNPNFVVATNLPAPDGVSTEEADLGMTVLDTALPEPTNVPPTPEQSAPVKTQPNSAAVISKGR